MGLLSKLFFSRILPEVHSIPGLINQNSLIYTLLAQT